MTKLRITFINGETLDINQSTLLDLAVYEKKIISICHQELPRI